MDEVLRIRKEKMITKGSCMNSNKVWREGINETYEEYKRDNVLKIILIVKGHDAIHIWLKKMGKRKITLGRQTVRTWDNLILLQSQLSQKFFKTRDGISINNIQSHFLSSSKDMLVDFRKRERERKKHWEPPTHKLGMCLNYGLNLKTFGVWNAAATN